MDVKRRREMKNKFYFFNNFVSLNDSVFVCFSEWRKQNLETFSKQKIRTMQNSYSTQLLFSSGLWSILNCFNLFSAKVSNFGRFSIYIFESRHKKRWKLSHKGHQKSHFEYQTRQNSYCWTVHRQKRKPQHIFSVFILCFFFIAFEFYFNS